MKLEQSPDFLFGQQAVFEENLSHKIGLHVSRMNRNDSPAACPLVPQMQMCRSLMRLNKTGAFQQRHQLPGGHRR
jgi:hypothetical protein